MSFFSKILEKLGLKKEQPVATSAPKPAASTTGGATAKASPSMNKGQKDDVMRPAPAVSAPVAPAPPKAISEVDVVKHLEQLSAGKGLNWKVSIVDLLKLLDIDSSREARNELAKELGCPPELMNDSAKMNVWLHKTVLRKIAENGGNIPKELLD
jgi:hypothetical protein